MLDDLLPDGGWPRDGVTEFLCERPGIGELRLVAPALAKLSDSTSRWILWVNPPHVPYAPALHQAGIDPVRVLVARPGTTRDFLWTLEKALASKSCSAVLAWPGNIRESEIRRLQVASREGECWHLMFRRAEHARQSSPAELGLDVRPGIPSPLSLSACIRVKILKRRGGWATESLTLDFNDRLNLRTPLFPDLEGSLDLTRPPTGNWAIAGMAGIDDEPHEQYRRQ